MKRRNLISVLLLLLFFAAGAYSQGLENFNNFPETGNQYKDGTFAGQDGSTWTYVQCRGDQAINAPNPCLGKNRTPASTLYSGDLTGGIGTLKFNYFQAFSSNVNLNVLVNDVVYATITTSGEVGIIKTAGPIDINVPGDFVIAFEQADNATSGQVAIDNVEWTAFGGSINPEPTAYPTAFTALANGLSIKVSWEDATGAQLPYAYIVMVNTTGVFSAPVDGTPVTDDIDLSDGVGAKNVAFGLKNYTFSGLSTQSTYYFTIYPYTNTGPNINFKTDGTAPAAYATTPSVVLTQDFEGGQGNFSAVSVTGTQAWTLDEIHGVNGSKCMRISGFENSVSNENEDWLISPAINLSAYAAASLSFWTAKNYTGNPLQVYISTDYAGSGDPNDYNWTELQAVLSPGSWTWTASGDIDITGFLAPAAYIGFKYTSTATESSTWEVDNVTVTGDNGGAVNPEPTNYPTAFTTSRAGFSIKLMWNDATGTQVPNGYLLLANKTGVFTAPVDGSPVADDIDLSDGSGAKNVIYGATSYTFSNLEEHSTYHFTIYPYTNSGPNIDYKSDGTAPTAKDSTEVRVFLHDFENGIEPFYAYSVTGSQVWTLLDYFGINDSKCVKMAGYENQVHNVNEDWLISPPMNFTTFTSASLIFMNAKNYQGDALKVYASTDYDGQGNPNSFTWTELQANLSTGGFAWTSSGGIDLTQFLPATLYIGFKYTCTDQASATWELDDIMFTGMAPNIGITETLPLNIKVFPNPATDQINITASEMNPGLLGIYNIYGQLVQKEVFDGKSMIINLGHLAKGLYVIRMESGNGAGVKFYKN